MGGSTSGDQNMVTLAASCHSTRTQLYSSTTQVSYQEPLSQWTDIPDRLKLRETVSDICHIYLLIWG